MKRGKMLLLLGLALVTSLGIVFIPRSGIVGVSATQWTGLRMPGGVAIGDYDNDGLNDLAFAEAYAGNVTVYKSDGTTIIKRWTGLSTPKDVAIGDYDNDGSNDLAFSEDVENGNVTVYKSDGTTIIKRWTGLFNPIGVSIGDYDNDGSNDLAFAESAFYAGEGNVTVYKSDGTTITKRLTGLTTPGWVAIGDYDNDGSNDIAVTEFHPPGQKVTVYKSDGTILKQWGGISYPTGCDIGDFNNDGLNDLAFAQIYVGTVTIYESDGTTILKKMNRLDHAVGVAIGDYNNDGLNDLALGEELDPTGRIKVYYQTTPSTAARIAEPTIVTLRGTLTNTTGYPIQSGSIRVTIKNSIGTELWQDTFNNFIDNGRYNIPAGAKTLLMLIRGQIYNAILEVDADSPTFVSTDVVFGDNDPIGDIIKFVAD